MAKHSKKKKKATTRRRRRVSGIGSGIDLQGIALAGAGAVLTSIVKKQLVKDPTKTTLVNLAPYVGLAAALVLPMVSKSAVVKSIAVGAGAMGVVEALRKLAPNMVGNLDVMPVISATANRYRQLPRVQMNGVGYTLPNSSVYKDSMSVVNGIDPLYSRSNAVSPGDANPGY